MTDDKGQEPTNAVEPTTEPTDATPEPKPEPKEDKKPDVFPRDYVEELRAENAKWRTQLRELEDWKKQVEKERADQEEAKLKEQGKLQELLDKRTEEFEKLQAQLRQKDVEVLRIKVAAQHGLNVVIDDDTGETLADRLRGDTEEELKKDAEKLAKLFRVGEHAEPAANEPAQEPEPEAEPDQTPARRQTTASPGGKPVGRTDTDRRRDYFHKGKESPFFQTPPGGGVTWNPTVPED